ncbi:MAG TPA: cyanophycinase [Drouetiella sp.]|jgi:cyanophycinase
MKPSSRSGGFFLIGGKSNTCYAVFLELAGGCDANIVIVPHASSIPGEAAADVVAQLASLGARNVSVLTPPSRWRARIASVFWKCGARRLSRMISDTPLSSDTDAVYISGGDQTHLVDKLGAGGVAALHAFSNAGGLICGTSAGAACMGDFMITGGMKDGVIRAGSLTTGKGLGLTGRTLFDTHMKRNRFNRPIVALASLDVDDAFGLDEDTGVHIQDGKARVYGVGKVWYYRRTASFRCDFSSGTCTGVDVEVRTAGGVFSL